MSRIASAFRNSAFYKSFCPATEDGKGRLCMLSSTVLSGIANSLSGGIFYSGFLLSYGIDIVNVGILTFMPYIATLFALISPSVLERFRKRRILLFLTRVLYYAINILGLTFLPQIVSDPTGRVIGIAAIVLIANSINNIFSPGYTAWHANFLPEESRADYFSIVPCLSSLSSGVILLITSAITDSLAPENQLTVLTLFRHLAFLIAILDCVSLLLPKEYEYPHSERQPKLYDCIVLPIKNRKFFLTMLLIFVYQFSMNMYNSVINVWLLEDAGVSYTFVNAVNTSFFLFFILFIGMAKRMLRHYGPFKTFGIAILVWMLAEIGYAFVNHENYLWLMLIVRLSQHWVGVLVNITLSTFLYIHLPEKDRTNYISFYTVSVNLSILLSMVFGTQFVSLMGNSTISIFGATLGSVPILHLICAAFTGLTAWLTFRWSPTLSNREQQ